MKRLLQALICALLASVPAATAAPQGAAGADSSMPDPATLHGQVAMLNQTITGMNSLLEQLLQRQEADLLMKRIQIATRGLTELERRVASTREELEGMSADRARLTEEIARVEEAMEDEEPQPGMPDTDRGRREMKEQMEVRLRFVSDRILSTENRLIDLENQLSLRLDDLAAWEELVDKALGLK